MSFVQSAIVEAVPRGLRSESGPSRGCSGDVSTDDVPEIRWGLSYEEVEREVRERLPVALFLPSLVDGCRQMRPPCQAQSKIWRGSNQRSHKHLVKQLLKTRSVKPRRIRIDSTTLEAHISYPNDVGILHQAVKTLIRTASSLGKKITSHVPATKRALFSWRQTAKANPTERKEKGRKILESGRAGQTHHVAEPQSHPSVASLRIRSFD
jgi:hypothetical protein